MYNLCISIGKAQYPYFETMGAYVAFKQMTGVEPSEVSDTEANLKYMYCVTKAACRHDDVEFSLTFEQFVDGLRLEEYVRISSEVAASVQNTDEPKK